MMRDYDRLRHSIGLQFSLTVPPYETVSAGRRGRLSRETLVSQALWNILIERRYGNLTLERAKSIAVFGVPIWMVVVRWLLKRVAIAVWDELNRVPESRGSSQGR